MTTTEDTKPQITDMVIQVHGNGSTLTETLDQRLTRIESQLTEMHSIFVHLYEAYEAMSSSPMFTALVGRMGK